MNQRKEGWYWVKRAGSNAPPFPARWEYWTDGYGWWRHDGTSFPDNTMICLHSSPLTIPLAAFL